MAATCSTPKPSAPPAFGTRASAGRNRENPDVEAILLAGGKAERLGDAAQGGPKALVPIAGRPLAAYQVALLTSAGVDRVLVSCAVGQEELFESELSGLGPAIVTVAESEPLGRGGGVRLTAQSREETGPVYV